MDKLNRCLLGDCRDVMRQLIAGGVQVQTIVTSPPYYGLRNYGHTDQLGLEATPNEYIANLVEVFRAAWDLLSDDGTLWLNIGDSYMSAKGCACPPQTIGGQRGMPSDFVPGNRKAQEGLKNKDLIGIPWMLAKALRDPYYTGTIKSELDRVWLAAMIDAEGSICGSEYKAKGKTKTNIYISITNTSVPIIDKCEKLFPQTVKHIYIKKNVNSERVCYRWDVEQIEKKSLFIREIYPHLIAKRKQAIVGYTFLELQRGLISKKKGYLPEQAEKRTWLISALSTLNSGKDIDLPVWCIEPPTLLKSGYYLRQDIIWHKPNPMPESVQDRCTKAHEYVFLLTKNPKYYCDMESIKEPSVDPIGTAKRYKKPFNTGEKNMSGGYSVDGGKQTAGMKNLQYKGQSNHSMHKNRLDSTDILYPIRNKRSVWTINTESCSEAHFAVMPEALVEPCILAGSKVGDIVFDPFMGSGTVGKVAQALGRKWLGAELNPDYIKIQHKRTAQHSIEFTV